MSWSFVAHVHTKHSFDSLADPSSVVRRAAALGIDVLAVTDHDTWEGSLEAERAAKSTGLTLRVVRGIEAATDRGDLIGLFLTSEVRARSGLEFCEAVHAQGGLVLLPHPCKGRVPNPDVLARVDMIEAWNARTPRLANATAAILAAELNLSAIAAPDAHRVGELGLARVEFEGSLPTSDAELKQALLEAPRRLVTSQGSIWNEWLSQGVKCWKKPDGRLAWHLARGAIRRVAKPAEYLS